MLWQFQNHITFARERAPGPTLLAGAPAWQATRLMKPLKPATLALSAGSSTLQGKAPVSYVRLIAR